MATCGTVRDINLSRMREYMLANRKVRIADAARETGMSIPTAAKLIGDLVENGEMKEVGCCASTGGRCAMVYEIDPGYLSYLLLRAEDGAVRYQMRDYAGECLEDGSFAAVSLQELDAQIDRFKQKYPNLRSAYIGMSTASAKDSSCASDLSAEHVPADADLPLYAEIDVNIVARARWQRSGLKEGCIVCICKTGVGLVIDGKILRGKKGIPGEMSLFQPLKNADSWSDNADPAFYQAFTAGVYAVALDPDVISIYAPEGDAPCDPQAVTRLLEKQLAPEYMPAIEAADCWSEDYWNGLDMAMRCKMGIL